MFQEIILERERERERANSPINFKSFTYTDAQRTPITKQRCRDEKSDAIDKRRQNKDAERN